MRSLGRITGPGDHSLGACLIWRGSPGEQRLDPHVAVRPHPLLVLYIVADLILLGSPEAKIGNQPGLKFGVHFLSYSCSITPSQFAPVYVEDFPLLVQAMDTVAGWPIFRPQKSKPAYKKASSLGNFVASKLALFGKCTNFLMTF